MTEKLSAGAIEALAANSREMGKSLDQLVSRIEEHERDIAMYNGKIGQCRARLAALTEAKAEFDEFIASRRADIA